MCKSANKKMPYPLSYLKKFSGKKADIASHYIKSQSSFSANTFLNFSTLGRTTA